MDDLIPFLVFIVIALINLGKFVLEKKAKGSPPATDEKQPPSRTEPSALEDFFGKLAEKLEPQPTPVPDWPEGYEKPDYLSEQEEYETEQEAFNPEPVAEMIPLPTVQEAPPPPSEIHTTSLKTAMASMPAISSGMGSLRLPSSPGMNSSTGGSIHFSLKSKKALRKAVLANIVFSAPRAFDASFENTIVK
ncbi:hypothetical protein P4B35_19770 [Pontiellaceae bacterium B12227]|nr:hypothetical protein [Pontiellaceae bacterium B12227]